MKKVALLSVDGMGFALAYHLQQEGNDVYVGQVQNWEQVQVKVKEEDKDRRKRLSLYDGMFDNKMSAEKLTSFLLGQPQSQRKDWVILCDFNWLHPQADRLRKAGYRGLLPHKEDYMLEHDRAATRKLIEELYPAIDTGDYQEFKTAKDAVAFLEKNEDKLYVLKGFNSDSETVVPSTDDPEHNHEILIDALEHDEKKLYEKDGFILEQKIPDIIEFTPEACAFDGELRWVNVNVEHKRLGSRNGPMTGCAAGVVVWDKEQSQIYDLFLEPLAKRMMRPNEITFWDLSVLYSPSERKFYAGEFCPNRMGYDAVFAEIACYGSATEWLMYLTGEADAGQRARVGASLRVFNTEKEDALIIGDPSEYWGYDVHRRDGGFATTGIGKDAYVLSAAGDGVDDAIYKLYEAEERVEFEPGLCLQQHDLFDTVWPQNILNRLAILNDLGLLKGNQNAKSKERPDRNRTAGNNVNAYASLGGSGAE